MRMNVCLCVCVCALEHHRSLSTNTRKDAKTRNYYHNILKDALELRFHS